MYEIQVGISNVLSRNPAQNTLLNTQISSDNDFNARFKIKKAVRVFAI